MPPLPKPKTIVWTFHSRAKMRQYGLSAQRVLRIIHLPKRVEEGIAVKTVAMMQPVTVTYNQQPITDNTKKETWKQELWVMFQDAGSKRKIISAWRYPGMSKVRSEAIFNLFRAEYDEFLAAEEKELPTEPIRPKIKLASKWKRPAGFGKPKFKWPSRPFRLKKSAPSNSIQLD